MKSVCSNEDGLFHWDLLTGSLSLDAQSSHVPGGTVPEAELVKSVCSNEVHC